MSPRFVVLFLALLALCCQALPISSMMMTSSPQVVDLYVASGTHHHRATGNNGTTPSSPFATIDEALNHIRLLRSDASKSSSFAVTLHLMSGMHYVAKTLQFDGGVCGVHPDGSTGTFTLNVVPYPATATDVTISGATLVDDFTQVSPYSGIWAARVPLAVHPHEMLWQIWDGRLNASSYGARQKLHSTPMLTYTNRSDSAPLTFTLNEDTLTGNFANVSDWSDAYVYVYHTWTSPTSKIESIQSSSSNGGTMTLDRSAPTNVWGGSGNRFRVVNLLQNQMASNTFTFNKTSRMLYWRIDSNNGGDSAPQALVPSVDVLLNFSHCHNVTFTNIAFKHTSLDPSSCIAKDGCVGTQGSDLPMEGGIMTTLSHNLLFSSCTFASHGNYAVFVGPGSHHVTIESSTITDLGTGGVRIGCMLTHAQINHHDHCPLVSFISLVGNHIYDGNYVLEFGDGVFVQLAADLRLEHNTIHDLYYNAFGVGWNWNFDPMVNKNIAIRHNHMYNLGRGLLSEVGCTHNLGSSPGSVVDHNLCHDVQSFENEGFGFWSDAGSSHLVYSNNIVYRTKGAAYNMHEAHNITLVNNVFAYPQRVIGAMTPSTGPSIFGGMRFVVPKKSDPYFIFERNIVLLRNESAAVYIELSAWDFSSSNSTIDRNCYWNEAVPSGNLSFPPLKPGRDAVSSTFNQWQQKGGHDTHSLIANPDFPSSDTEYNFEDISASSPCLALGFVPINLTGKVGHRHYSRRV